jgi:aryl-alcohol dehydrogenase-like predicted oxidoreductase
LAENVNQLRTRHLGRAAIQVSELGLGGYQFTGEFGVPRREAQAIIKEALNSGENFIDTAPMYGAGESEELIGRAIIDTNKPVVISGKLGYLDLTVSRYFGTDGYRSEEALRRVAEHSLHLLRRPKFDILFIHEPEWPEWEIDPATADSVVTSALERMRAEGLTDAIGVAGQDVDRLTALIDTGRFDVVLSVMQYDLTTHRARDILFPAARRHGAGIILGTPLRQGLLASYHAEPMNAMVADADRPREEQVELAATLTRVYQLARDLGMPVPELALRYLLSDPQIASVIPGARSVEDVRSNLRAAARGPLPKDLVAEIEATHSAAESRAP